MDTTVVMKQEPVCSEHSSAVLEIFPDADNMKLEDTMNISFEWPVPMIKEEVENFHSVIEIAPDIKTFEEDRNESMQEEPQKLESGHGSYLSSYVKTVEEHAIDSQHSLECRLHSPPHNSVEPSPSVCEEVSGNCGSLEEAAPPQIKHRYSCDLCGNTFATPKNLRIHEKVHTGERPYPCNECGFSFKEKYTLQRHLKVHSNSSTISKTYSCRHCSRFFSSNSGLKLHKLFCDNLAKPCCSDELGITCAHNTNSKARRSRPLKTFSPVSCYVCGKYFQKEGYLKQHMAYHSEERPYTCNECGQGFKCRKDITNHLNIHSHFRKFSCDICGKEFGGSGVLTQHKRSHSDHRNYNCNDCGKAFKSRNDIVNHVIIHSNVRPFICDICGFAARRNLELSLHKTRHSDERPYSCHTCGKTFKHQLYLNKHNRGHVSPQSCGICGKNFETPHYLTVHMRLHGTEKPYACDICKKSFIRRSYLTEHIKGVHV